MHLAKLGFYFMSNNQPEFLYKYLPFNDGSKSVISQNTIKYTCQKDFNDPFDCQIPVNFKANKKTIRKYFLDKPHLLGSSLPPAKRLIEASKKSHVHFSSVDINQELYLR